MSSRRLAAILAADVVGYSALMAADEIDTVSTLKGHQAVILPMITAYSGRIIDTAGDGIVAEFASVLNAVKCAVAIQEIMLERNASTAPDRLMQFRIGINQGDVLFDDNSIFGDGINIAARLEEICQPGSICISGKVYDEIKGRFEIQYEDIGEQALKNIPAPVRAYAVTIRGAGRGVDASPIARGAAAGLTKPQGRHAATPNLVVPLAIMFVSVAALAGAGAIYWSATRTNQSAPASPVVDSNATEPTKRAGPSSINAKPPLFELLLARYAITVPSLSRETRERNARSYENDKLHKAQAVSLSPPGIWRSTGRASPQIAEESVLESCQVFYGKPCTLIIVDDSIVPIPENGEWPRRDMPRVRYAGHFDPNQIPGVAHLRQRADITGYAAVTSFKAVAFHPWGRIFIVIGAANQREAEEQALDRCNKDPERNKADGECFLYASGNQVILPQRLKKPAS